MLSVKDAFDILGLSSDASLKEVRKAYLALVRSWHPDRHSHDVRLQHLAEERLKEINAAYQIAKKNVGKVPSSIDSPFRFNPSATGNGGDSVTAPPQGMEPQQVLLRPKNTPALHNFLLGSLGLSTAWFSFNAYGFTTDALLYFLLIMTIPAVCGMICNSSPGTSRLRYVYVTSILLAGAATVFHQVSLRMVSAVPSITQGGDETAQGAGSVPSVTGGRPGGYTLEPVNREAERGLKPPATPSTPSTPEMIAPQPPSTPVAPSRR